MRVTINRKLKLVTIISTIIDINQYNLLHDKLALIGYKIKYTAR